MTVSRRICVVTGTRAEYGLLRCLLADLSAQPGVTLQIIAAAMHLAPEFGLTCQEIEADGYVLDRKIEMLLASDSGIGMAKSTGVGMLGFADAFGALQPDLVVLLGDRFEVLAAASTALLMRLPIAHIHGGELTEGAVDDAIRHAVSKMAAVHFAAAEPYRNRLIQMGEMPERVHCVGGLGVDAILRTPLLEREALEASLGFSFGKRNLLVTFHPATAEDGDPLNQCEQLLAAMDSVPDCHFIVTLPNADAGGRAIAERLLAYGRENPMRVGVFASLGAKRYLSCLALVDGVIGNSSSGLLEAPTFGIGTVNIGNRQKGRLKASSVIDCAPEQHAIEAAIAKILSESFRKGLTEIYNPYGDGGAARRIAEILVSVPLEALRGKTFCDSPLF